MSLPATNLIPSVLTNARIYLEGDALLGAGKVELPDIEYMTESITGLGVAGELEVPVKGHFKSMTVKISWNVTEPAAIALLDPVSHQLDVRGSIQKLDAGTGEFRDCAVKVLLRCAPKKTGLGSVEPGKKMDPETEMEISAMKLWLDGAEMVEIDKLNMLFSLRGVDMLKKLRSNLGMD